MGNSKLLLSLTIRGARILAQITLNSIRSVLFSCTIITLSNASCPKVENFEAVTWSLKIVWNFSGCPARTIFITLRVHTRPFSSMPFSPLPTLLPLLNHRPPQIPAPLRPPKLHLSYSTTPPARPYSPSRPPPSSRRKPPLSAEAIRQTPAYKSKARQITTIMVALPFFLVTSYLLLERGFSAGEERKMGEGGSREGGRKVERVEKVEGG